MSRLLVHNISLSLDGFAAGAHQSLDQPLGIGGEDLHRWMFADPMDPVDADFRAAFDHGIGATIMGRNMFGPVRGTWPDESWRGWWGEEPPYHHDVFVLTHHPRDPIPMEGGTTFRFVTDGIEAALDQARAAAGGQDVLVAGGVATLQQFLRAGLIDEMDLVFSPILLGEGERLLDGPIPYRCTELVPSATVVHARFVRADS